MYIIHTQSKTLSAKKSIDQTTSLGLGISVLQLVFSLYRLSQFGCKDEESLVLFGDNPKPQEKVTGGYVSSCGPTSAAAKGELQKLPPVETFQPLLLSKSHLPISQQELGRCIAIGVALYAELFLVIVDAYLYRFLLRETQKENIGSCWLGFYLQISLLTYDVAEILIVAHNGVFDGSSMLLAARATVRALSIDMIFLFLREIEDKQETDGFLYVILNV